MLKTLTSEISALCFHFCIVIVFFFFFFMWAAA